MLVALNKAIVLLARCFKSLYISHRAYHCTVSRLPRNGKCICNSTEVTLVTRSLSQGDDTWAFLGMVSEIQFSSTLVCIRWSSPFGPKRLTHFPASLFAWDNYKLLWFTGARWSKAGLEFAFQMHCRWFTSILLHENWQHAQDKLNHIILKTHFSDCREDRNFGLLG